MIIETTSPSADDHPLRRSFVCARWDLLEQAKAKWAIEHPLPYDRALRVSRQMAEQARRAGARLRTDRPIIAPHKLLYARAINAR